MRSSVPPPSAELGQGRRDSSRRDVDRQIEPDLDLPGPRNPRERRADVGDRIEILRRIDDWTVEQVDSADPIDAKRPQVASVVVVGGEVPPAPVDDEAVGTEPACRQQPGVGAVGDLYRRCLAIASASDSSASLSAGTPGSGGAVNPSECSSASTCRLSVVGSTRCSFRSAPSAASCALSSPSLFAASNPSETTTASSFVSISGGRRYPGRIR